MMAVRSDLAQKLASLPEAPGVYLMKDRRGQVIYVGKAKSLRDRVRSYFSGSDTRAFVALLDDILADLEVVLTHSEKEALILENELIKQHQPRFNVKLTDDSRYLCLRLDLRHRFPRLEVVRRFANDGARYFGPYHSASAIRETLRMVNRHFQLRTCSDQVLATRKKPCLQYQIKRCTAPCVFEDLAGGAYATQVAHVRAFLEGRHVDLLNTLRRRMQQCAEDLQFEAAAHLRDQIKAIEKSLEQQTMVESPLIHRDVVGIYREGGAVELTVMRVRHGRLIDASRFSINDQEALTADVLNDFAVRFYAERQDIPEEIVFPDEMHWSQALSAFLAEKSGHTVAVITPKRGAKKRWVELANRNARQAFLDKQRQAGAARTAVERLQRALHLSRPPETLECFDISHVQGQHIVASCVHFHNGVARKEMYRLFKIKSTTTQDDFKSIYEVVSRRARRALEEGDLPHLLVIDGGKGQLAAARAALDDHGIDHVDIIALAKSRLLDEPATQTTLQPHTPPPSVSTSPERVFISGQKNPVVLRQDSAELFLLTRARDEAHRFAITFHRRLRSKTLTASALDTIPGVGKARRNALLKQFGSVAQIKKASQEELAAVVGAKLAAVIAAHWRG